MTETASTRELTVKISGMTQTNKSGREAR